MKMKRKLKVILFFAVLLAALIVGAISSFAEHRTPLAELAVEVESYTFGSERSEPVVVGNIENASEKYYLRRHTDDGSGEWREITARPVSDGMPTDGGRYELRVVVSESENYSGGEAVCEFYVYPTDLDISLSMTGDVYFGDSADVTESIRIDDLLGRAYTAYFSAFGEDSYSKNVPSAAGKYTVKVTVAATDNYKMCEKTLDFEIKKRDISAEVEIKADDCVYGESVSASLEYIGKLTQVKDELSRVTVEFEYRRLPSGTYDKSIPTDAGRYEVRVRIYESENIAGGEIVKGFEIKKAPISPTVTMPDLVYGEDIGQPSLSEGSNPGDAEVVYYYAPDGSDNYTSELPWAAGNYSVKAVISESDNYLGGECYDSFVIEKAELEAVNVIFNGWTYGESASVPRVDGILDGAAVSYHYAVRGDELYTDYLDAPPSEAGEYTLRVTVSEKENYKEAVIYIDFTVEKADIYITVFAENWVYGETPRLIGISGNEENAEYKLSFYKKSGAEYIPVPESELQNERPYLAGNYRVVCDVSESKNYKGYFGAETEFTVEKAVPDIVLTMDDYSYYSNPSRPSVSGNIEGGDTSFIYYPKGGDINKGSPSLAEIVSAPGEYTVTVLIGETANYRFKAASCDFTVKKADLPAGAMALEIKSGGTVTEKIVFGEEYELLLKNNVGYGKISYSFRKLGSEGEFTSDKPCGVGRHTVKVDIAATDVYKPLTVYFEIEIVRAERGELKLEIADFVYGGEMSRPSLSGNVEEISEADKNYSYKPFGAPDSEYSTVAPQKAGKYTVRLLVSETESYNSVTLTADFTVKKAQSVITASNLSYVYDGSPKSVVARLNHSEAELEYVGNGKSDAGEYLVTVSVPESENYEGATLTVGLTVLKAIGEITDIGTISKTYDGEPVGMPSYTVKGDGTVTVEFYKGEQKLKEAPRAVGDYIVKIILSEGKNYGAGYAMHSFSISPMIMGEISERGDDENSEALWLYIILMILLLLVAVLVAVIILYRRREGGDGYPYAAMLPTPNDEGGVAMLPASSVSETAADERAGTEKNQDEHSEDENTEDANEVKEETESAEKAQEKNEIVLPMPADEEIYEKESLPNEDTEAEENEQVVGVTYKKGGRCAEINIDTICRHFNDGDTVDMEALMAKKLIDKNCKRVKLLGRGELTKQLDIRLDSYSRRAFDFVRQD